MPKTMQERFEQAKIHQMLRSKEVDTATGKRKIVQSPLPTEPTEYKNISPASKRKKYRDYLLTFDNKECGICKKPFTEATRFLHLDHCHTTGDIRGLLCHNCNIGLGMFKDNVTFLEAAIDYLLRVDRKTKDKIEPVHSSWTTPIEPTPLIEPIKHWWNELPEVWTAHSL